MSKVQIPDWSHVSQLIDWDAVNASIIAAWPNGGFDEISLVRDMVWAAAKEWLPRDLVEFKIETVEEKFERACGASQIKGYFDVLATLRGTLKPFNEYANSRIIIDWKTTWGPLDDTWRWKHIDSWQGYIYAYLSGAALVNFRGVSTRVVDGDCSTKDLLVVVPPSNVEEVEEYVKGLVTQRNALIDSGFDIWPRNRPRACHYGRSECPYYTDCTHYSMPRFNLPKEKVMSFSSLQNFIVCPEFSRRLEKDKEGDMTEESNLGSVFHTGIGEVYKQAQKLEF